MLRNPDGTTIEPQEWGTREHAAVERGIANVSFPATRGDVIEQAGDVQVLDEPRVTLRPYLETLPERGFADDEEISRVLNRTWGDAARKVS